MNKKSNNYVVKIDRATTQDIQAMRISPGGLLEEGQAAGNLQTAAPIQAFFPRGLT